MEHVAVYMKSDSCDDYIFCLEKESVEDVIYNLKSKLGETLGYIGDYYVATSDDDSIYDRRLEDAIIKVINDMYEDE